MGTLFQYDSWEIREYQEFLSIADDGLELRRFSDDVLLIVKVVNLNNEGPGI